MPRRSIRLPTCLQERLVPLLRLVFLPPSRLPPPISRFIPPFSLFLSLWYVFDSSLSHHLCFIRSHLVVNFIFILVTHMVTFLFFAFHHTRIITTCWIAKLLIVVEIGRSWESRVFAAIPAPLCIYQSSMLSYSTSHTLDLLIARPLPDRSCEI